MAELVHRTWHGDELIARERRANGRAIVGMAVGAAVEMKKVTHEISGDLKRSVHAAAVDSMGGREVSAESQENARTGEASWAVEVGSWLPYACVENNRGGEHRFADIGWELARPFFDPKLVRAWKDEGL